MEESRGELTFATERVSMSLAGSLSARSNPDNQLDEIEIRKGLLQVQCAAHLDCPLARVLARIQATSHQSYAQCDHHQRQRRLEAGGRRLLHGT